MSFPSLTLIVNFESGDNTTFLVLNEGGQEFKLIVVTPVLYGLRVICTLFFRRRNLLEM